MNLFDFCEAFIAAAVTAIIVLVIGLVVIGDISRFDGAIMVLLSVSLVIMIVISRFWRIEAQRSNDSEWRY